MAASEAFLRRAVDHVRLYAMETLDEAIWSEARVVEQIDTANALVFGEMYPVKETKTYPTFDEASVSLVTTTEDYNLPGNCRQLLRLVHKDSDGHVDREILPTDLLSELPGMVIFGRNRGFRLRPKPSANETWVAQYLAGPTPYLHYGTAQTNADTSKIILASSATLGSIAVEDDFYINSWVRIISGTGAGQKRRITDYVGSTKTATVSPAWATAPTNDSVYEILPCLDHPLDKAIMWRAVMMLKAADSDVKHRLSAEAEYRAILRDVLGQESDVSGRTGPTIMDSFLTEEAYGESY